MDLFFARLKKCIMHININADHWFIGKISNWVIFNNVTNAEFGLITLCQFLGSFSDPLSMVGKVCRNQDMLIISHEQLLLTIKKGSLITALYGRFIFHFLKSVQHPMLPYSLHLQTLLLAGILDQIHLQQQIRQGRWFECLSEA